ncbi:hypothetical protein ACFL2V_18325, partial [Pseudomonadota bacterium]
MALTARKVFMDHKPPLVVSNSSLAISLGPFFHWITGFLLSLIPQHSPVILLLLGSVLGCFTTLTIYLTLKSVSKNVAYISSFLYASSFLVSLFDRRWWPLTFNSIFVVLSIFALTKILKGKHSYLLLLATLSSFSFHADPSLSVIPISSLLVLVLLKIKLNFKQLIPPFLVVLFFLTPLALFELRHPGKVTGPIVNLTSNPYSSKANKSSMSFPSALIKFTQNHAKGLFAKPTDSAELYLCHCPSFNLPLASPIPEIIVVTSFVGLIAITRQKKYQELAKILLIFQTVFFLGMFVFNQLS